MQVRTRRALPPGGYRRDGCIERRSHRRRRRGTRADEEARPPLKAQTLQTGRSQADREGVRRLGGQDPGQLCSRRLCRSRRRHLRPVVARRVLAGPGESPPRPSQPRARTGPRRVRTSAPRDERGGVLRVRGARFGPSRDRRRSRDGRLGVGGVNVDGSSRARRRGRRRRRGRGVGPAVATRAGPGQTDGGGRGGTGERGGADGEEAREGHVRGG
mmetsp:Transcript_11285/g.47182  ORF Transcript_11285/g.47182 Transcript_11285/m.47182 type:complete len:215 (+) Transcript_11285:536-1180(+)